MMLSDECREALLWYVEGEDYEDDFLRTAGMYVAWASKLSKHEKHNMAVAQDRIDRVKKAFAKLTDQDREFLDLQIDFPEMMKDISYKPSSACKNMQKALDVSVPSSQFDLSRMSLLNFACIAVRNDWIATSENNSDLKAVILTLMKEAGVRHDADEIAGEAVKNPGQAFPEAYLNIFDNYVLRRRLK